MDEFVPAETQPRLRELSYDANGNHKQWKYRNSPQRTLSWDEDNRLVSVSLVSVSENGQELSRALYDGAGERRVHLHRVAGEEETAYVDQHLVVRNGVVATKHLFAGATRIASKIDADWFQEPPVLYYHPDQLGSTQYVTDQDQQLSQHVEYLPSGELWADQTDSRFQNRQPYLFTGKELDLSTGLYYHGARSYEPRLGVWLSPDPVLAQYMAGRINGGVYRPITLGLYTYASNNPVVLVDLNGQFDDATRKFIATVLVVAAAEPTPVGEVVVAGMVVVGSIGYAGYLIFDAAANGNTPKPPESFPIPEDTPQDVAAPSPPPPAAGGGGAKDPPAPPAPPAAESPEPPRKPATGAAGLRDLSNMTRSEAERALAEAGFDGKKVSDGGWQTWRHPDGSKVDVNWKTGRMVRTAAPERGPDGRARINKGQRLDASGKPIPRDLPHEQHPTETLKTKYNGEGCKT
ncbi:hypothetical protein BE17_37960 [Sorangium cellulosum]|uniref:Teneurin-like YD-shell domain-containing protein n=1 Tax=Sorangium cellulosum TaxID=56 RepID=A0A150R7E0_SORCE|nr:hypothetical protein BE17_37960 [Sorangium cellulosum]